MSWQVKAIAVQPDNLSVIPRNHEERRELIPAIVLCHLNVYSGMPTLVLTHRENNKTKQINKNTKGDGEKAPWVSMLAGDLNSVPRAHVTAEVAITSLPPQEHLPIHTK